MRSHVKYVALILLITFAACTKNDSRLQDGDLVFHTSHSSQSQAIQLATKSEFSHMGIILTLNNKQMVYEAVGSVKYTPLRVWIKRGTDNHFVARRLKNAKEELTPQNLANLKKVAETFKGKPYDFVFGWSDEKMYCSELIWKIYDRALNVHIGSLQHLRDFDLSNPIVSQKLRECYPDCVPMDETVISPEQMFRSESLITVLEE
jgi:uncharacterized protein YycO